MYDKYISPFFPLCFFFPFYAHFLHGICHAVHLLFTGHSLDAELRFLHVIQPLFSKHLSLHQHKQKKTKNKYIRVMFQRTIYSYRLYIMFEHCCKIWLRAEEQSGCYVFFFSGKTASPHFMQ